MDSHKIADIGNSITDAAILALLISVASNGDEKRLERFETTLHKMLASAFDSNELPEVVKDAIRNRIHNLMSGARAVADAAKA